MKLVAIWIENYMRIKNQFFNFGSEWTYYFSFEEKKKQLQITRKKTNNYINLFDNTEIINITGIIGKNGSGKTSLLKLLNVIYSKSPLTHNVILLFEKENKILIKIYKQEAIIPKPEFFKKENINTKITNSANITISPDPFKEIDLIFYSKLVSGQNDKYIANELNRSTDFQIRQSLTPEKIKEYLEDYENVKDSQILAKKSFDILKLYEKEKLKRHINFIANVKSKYAELINILDGINLPENIDIWFNNDYFIKHTNNLIKRSNYDFKKLQDVYKFCFDKINSDNNIKLRFKNQLIYTIFLFSFYNDCFKFSKNNSLSELEEFVNNLLLDATIFEQLKKYLLKQQPYTNTTIKKIKDLLEYLEDYFKYFEISKKNVFGIENYRIEINDKLWSFLNQILSITDFADKNLIKYSLNPMSAGEDAIINQFSEFYEAISLCRKESVYLSIDEGELFLHPEWQRRYINNLFLFFNFFGQKEYVKFQLFITSHSPFIVSDIPKFNIIFLDKDKKGNCKVSISEIHKNTFGGNIFELFNNSFFVNEFISEFAYNSLNELLKQLNNDELTLKNKDLTRIETIINLIGEPIIKEELKKLLNRKRNNFFKENFTLIN